MKRTVLISLLAITATQMVHAQKIKSDQVPAAITSTFSRAYPRATDVRWEKEKSGDYEVDFTMQKEEMSVVYNDKGKALEVEKAITVSELPRAVQAALKGKKIKEAAEIKKEGKTYYEAEVNGHDLIFDANGAPVKMD